MTPLPEREGLGVGPAKPDVPLPTRYPSIQEREIGKRKGADGGTRKTARPPLFVWKRVDADRDTRIVPKRAIGGFPRCKMVDAI